jgi:DNA-binding response OmpR family regulator
MSGAHGVLIVDDDPDSRTLLEIALSIAGYAVASATNGAEALIAAKRCSPKVILLDLAMPVMDGFAFRAAQLRDPDIARIPVICVSGRHDASCAARELKLDACVSKPFCLDEIVLRVAEVLSGTSDGLPPRTATL